MRVIARIHHEYPSGIRKSYPEGEYFGQGKGMPSPWPKYSFPRVNFLIHGLLFSGFGRMIFAAWYSKHDNNMYAYTFCYLYCKSIEVCPMK